MTNQELMNKMTVDLKRANRDFRTSTEVETKSPIVALQELTDLRNKLIEDALPQVMAGLGVAMTASQEVFEYIEVALGDNIVKKHRRFWKKDA